MDLDGKHRLYKARSVDPKPIPWVLRLEYTKGEAEALRQLSRAEAARPVDGSGLVVKLFWIDSASFLIHFWPSEGFRSQLFMPGVGNPTASRPVWTWCRSISAVAMLADRRVKRFSRTRWLRCVGGSHVQPCQGSLKLWVSPERGVFGLGAA